MNTPQERLEYFINQRFKKLKDFSQEMGLQPSDVYKYTKKGSSIFQSHDKIEKLSNLGLNIPWYISGEGEKFNSNFPKIANYNSESDVNSVQEDSTPYKVKVYEPLNAGDISPNNNPYKVITSEERLVKILRDAVNDCKDYNELVNVINIILKSYK